jgi:hypothetical protein
MSERSQLSRGRRQTEPRGPVGRLIAEALHHRSLSEAAALYKKAARDAEGVRDATCSPSTVRKWIHDLVIPQPFARRCISAAWNIPIERLDDAIEAQRAQQPPPAAPVDSDDVKRRSFATFLALAGTSAMAGVDLDRFAAVLGGTRVDEPALDDLETLTLDLVHREATLAPASLLPAVRGHLAGLRDVLVWTPPALAPRACSLAGQTALLAGYLWFKQDNHSEADLYWSLADRFGDLAGDLRLRAALLVLQGQRWHGESIPQDGANLPLTLTLLDRAVSLLGPNPEPAAAAHVLTFRACAHAEANHTNPAYAARSMHDLDSLQTHLSRMPSVDSGIYIVESIWGEAVQKGAMALVHLGRAADAASDLEGLLASIERASLSWRAGITSDLAAAHAGMGEPEHASDLLSASLRLATQASALRAVNRVRHARQRWLPDYDGPATRRLDEQLLALSPPPANGSSGNSLASLS